MANAYFNVEFPKNEPVLSYAPGSPEKASLKAKLEEMRNQTLDIPLLIGGKEIRTGNTDVCRIPHNHEHVLATFHKAGPEEVQMAIDAAMEAREKWAALEWQDRIAVFLKAADLLAGPWRDTINAATMLGQSKNAFQAEIDAACELADFLRFNCYFATQIYRDQPTSGPGIWNRMEYRPLEGFIFAVSPFNFTSIGGNLCSAPATVGNVALWKPASSCVYSNYFVMKVFEAAGLPAGVINFIPGSGAKIGDQVLKNEHLAGVHFTGSTRVFQSMWKTIGENISNYHGYPRIVGETGGKDFIFAHKSADAVEVGTAITRGAFEYQGQKCSAASRAYIPDNLWDVVKSTVVNQLDEITMGDPEDFTHFVNAVIDQNAFNTIKEYIDFAKESPDAEIIAGGTCDDSTGYYIEPTVILAKTPDFKTMTEEIFGPVMTIYVYPEDEFEEAMELCNGNEYALTGAIFSGCRYAIAQATDALSQAAGNFYINDKPTGAVVGQQPFGGARASGTNDKAGSALNLYRWISPRTLKENFVPPKDYKYPFMGEA